MIGFGSIPFLREYFNKPTWEKSASLAIGASVYHGLLSLFTLYRVLNGYETFGITPTFLPWFSKQHVYLNNGLALLFIHGSLLIGFLKWIRDSSKKAKLA